MQMIKKDNFGIPDKYLEIFKEIFIKYPKIEKAILYGSRAKGNFTTGSDIDIALVAPKMSFSEYLSVLAELEDLDIPYKLDITKYELLDENIKEHIKRVGKIIYLKDNL